MGSCTHRLVGRGFHDGAIPKVIAVVSTGGELWVAFGKGSVQVLVVILLAIQEESSVSLEWGLHVGHLVEGGEYWVLVREKSGWEGSVGRRMIWQVTKVSKAKVDMRGMWRDGVTEAG